jgi:hypothetical protein
MKSLWLILLVSVMILGTVIYPKSKSGLFEVIEHQVFQGNESLKRWNDVIFNVIKKQVESYPRYQEYLEHADSTRQIIIIALENKNTDLETIIPKLTRPLKDESEYEKLRKKLRYLDLRSIRKQPLDIALSQSELLCYETGLLTYFAGKMYGGCIGRDWTESLMLNTKKPICVNESVKLKYIVSSISSCNYYDFKIWLNNELLVLDKKNPYRSSFKLRPTTIGKNTFEITIDGRNRRGGRERTTKKFEFWVEE